MIIGSSSLHNISSSYSIKLNEEETLEFRKEKTPKSPDEEKKEQLEESKEKQQVKSDASKELTAGEQQQVIKLQARDTEVRAHEAAHQAAGGGLTGAASLSYQQGPDGKMYAIGGEVSIAMKGGSTPEESIQNARQIMAAAMAPANPSPQDYSVASSARVMEMKAQQQLARQEQEEMLGKDAYKNNDDASAKDQDDKDLIDSINLSA